MNYRWLFTLINFVGRGTVCKGRFVAISQSGQYVWTIRAVSRVHGSLLTVPSPVSAIDSQLHHSAFCFFPSSISSSLGRTIGSWARTANKRKHQKKNFNKRTIRNIWTRKSYQKGNQRYPSVHGVSTVRLSYLSANRLYTREMSCFALDRSKQNHFVTKC